MDTCKITYFIEVFKFRMGALSKRTKWGDVESLHNTDDESDCKRVIGFASKRMKQDYLDEENSVPEEDDTSEDEMDEDEDESDGSDAGQNGRQIDEEMDELEKQYQNLRSEEQNLLKNLKRQKDEDVVKGQAVKNQKVLWDKTLELRFLLQKAFSSSNKLPQEPVKSLFCSSAQNVDQAYSDLIFSARFCLRILLSFRIQLGNVADGNVDGDPELLDDSEFYLQLLKEFLESNLSSSETAYYALRKLQPKKRKVVDRRASKNRKIRYHVHEKIANFMAPVPMVLPSMAPKLFENLFGLNKEKSNSGI